MIRAIKGFFFLFTSRGINRWIGRLVTVQKRFGFTPQKQMNIIKGYESCLKRHGIRGTFFIPAVLLKKYQVHLKAIDQMTIEWGMHGYVHTDHSMLSFDEHMVQLTKAIQVFDECGFPFTGFRCPYLHYNEHTRVALAKLDRFTFDSSDSILWEDLYGSTRANYSWTKDFYKTKNSKDQISAPYLIGTIIEIPVSLPDDDTLVDREHMDPKEILSIWKQMLNQCHARHEIFVLQLHPERFFVLQDVLEELIKEAKALNPPIKIATLSEVAKLEGKHLKSGVFCITGDIDAITIQDFFARLQDW